MHTQSRNYVHRAPVRASMAPPDVMEVDVFDRGVNRIQRLASCIDTELDDLGDRIRGTPLGVSTCLAPALTHANAVAQSLPRDTIKVVTIIGDGEIFDLAKALHQADLAKAAWIRINAVLIGDSGEGAEHLRAIVGRTVGGAFTKAKDFRELTAAVLATRKAGHNRVAAHIVLIDRSPSMGQRLADAPHLRRIDGAAAALEMFVNQRRHLHG